MAKHLLRAFLFSTSPLELANFLASSHQIEGLITMAIAIASWFVLCDDPQKARWLNEEEKGELSIYLRYFK